MVESSLLPTVEFSLLPDPLTDRPLKDKDCPMMANKELTDEQFW
jgi:hypothetical protein